MGEFEPRAAASQTGGQSDTADAAAHSQPEPVLVPGELVGRYRVRRLVGQGGMGRVYLARDMTLGRSVALKVIRASSVKPEQFVSEARITAQLNHPHIVQLYDVGSHGSIPYLAFEYLEGESLRERLQRERPTVDESLRVLVAIAEALTHAHARGIRHCDLKPSNVMLPRDGRVRIVDFGLGTERAGVVPVAMAGTADWMAPEQWRAEPPSDRTDIWALAVIAYELLCGDHPFGAAADRGARRDRVLDVGTPPSPLAREGLPEGVTTLILRSLGRDAQTRPPATEWVAVLGATLSTATPGTTAENPFRGLSAFEERHTELFFGRDDEIGAFLERFRDTAILPIVGPSGVGKSSFLFAGLVPRLRGRERWTVIAFRPGQEPITALAHRLVTVSDGSGSETSLTLADRSKVASLANELREQPSLLACRLATIATATQTRVLLAVDQLEELFTQGAPSRDVDCFLAMLASAADDASEPVRVTYTLRDDFLGRVPAVQSLFVLGALDDAHLRRTITGPLDRLGYAFDNPAIIDDMLSDVRGTTTALPLVQFACRALWEARDVDRHLLVESAYRLQGGVAGALARHADAVVAAMSVDEQHVSRAMLTRLVVGTNTRRILERSALLSDLPEWATSVLDRLLAARLLTQHRTSGQVDTSVEIAHESLLTTWGQLARWLEESGEERRLLLELEEATSFWDKRGRRVDETWTTDEIVGARRHAEKLALRLPERVERFLAAGDFRESSRRRRARVRVIAIVTAALVVAIVSVVFANQFREQRNEAERQAAALRLARGNMGEIELVFEPFDWVEGAPRAVPAAELPGLAWRLYSPAPGDVDLPGAPFSDELVKVTGHRIEAPGGMAFLRIDGRGRRGEHCAAAWIRILALPGYAERAEIKRLTIPVPTCQASLGDTVLVPAGDFIYGGPGSPPTRYSDYEEPERVVTLADFRIDKTEVSNAMFAPFVRVTSLSGYDVPKYPPPAGALPTAGAATSPVTSIDAFEAEAFCRYMGKRLPTDHEWTKAARGGLEVDGQPNPAPRRLYPWGTEFRPTCVNLDGLADGHDWVAPVDAIVCGASPYGAVNLTGNVAEWIARTGQTDSHSELRVIRGGAADSPAELEQVTTVFRNAREARRFDFSIGVRCVADASPETGSIWERH